MKNDKIGIGLNQELRNVRISEELKERIIAEAVVARNAEKRQKIRLAPLAAAAVFIMICGLTLGMISLKAERVERRSTVMNEGSGQGLNGSQVLSSGNGEWVWVSDSDKLYHVQNPCGSANDMTRVRLEQAWEQNRGPCAQCMPGSENAFTDGLMYAEGVPEENVENVENVVWATEGGVFYHIDEHCSGMRNASAMTIERAENIGKTVCPNCIGGFENGGFASAEEALLTFTPAPVEQTPEPKIVGGVDLVWTTGGGRFYHCDEHCSGMEGAVQKTFAEVVAAKLNACPVCYVLPAETIAAVSGQEEAWITEGGKYYHCDEHCSGMQNAKLWPVDKMTEGEEKCPVCYPELDAACTPVPGRQETDKAYFATEGGEYFHATSDCSGMQNAALFSASELSEKEKKPCPVCLVLGEEAWAEYIADASIFMELSSDGENLTLVSIPELKLEWIDYSQSKPVDLEQAEVADALENIAAECMDERELARMKALLEKGEIMGFRAVRYNFFFADDALDDSADAYDDAYTDSRYYSLSVPLKGKHMEVASVGVVATEIACLFHTDGSVDVLTGRVGMVEESRMQTDAGWEIRFSQERAGSVFPAVITDLSVAQMEAG